MSAQYGELRSTSGWDRFTSLGHPCKFQRLSRLGSVTARQSSSECQPNFVALIRGRHLCSAGRPSRWALAHISSITIFLFFFLSFYWVYRKCFGLVIAMLLHSLLLLCLFWTNKHDIVMMMINTALWILGLMHIAQCWRTYIIFVSYRNCGHRQLLPSTPTSILLYL